MDASVLLLERPTPTVRASEMIFQDIMCVIVLDSFCFLTTKTNSDLGTNRHA